MGPTPIPRTPTRDELAALRALAIQVVNATTLVVDPEWVSNVATRYGAETVLYLLMRNADLQSELMVTEAKYKGAVGACGSIGHKAYSSEQDRKVLENTVRALSKELDELRNEGVAWELAGMDESSLESVRDSAQSHLDDRRETAEDLLKS